MTRERQPPPSQLSFLAPDDAHMVHMMRRFLAEASRIYETRTGASLENPVMLTKPAEVYEFLRLEMAGLEQEQLRVLSLTTKHHVISAPTVYQGTIGSTPIRVAEIFRPAIVANAAAIIVAHNHPSGDPAASPDDIHATKTLIEAGRLLDIPVLDHIIIAARGFVSLRETGYGLSW